MCQYNTVKQTHWFLSTLYCYLNCPSGQWDKLRFPTQCGGSCFLPLFVEKAFKISICSDIQPYGSCKLHFWQVTEEISVAT